MLIQLTKFSRCYLSGIFLFVCLFVSVAYAIPAKTINYQGFLTNPDGVPVNKTVKMKFRIYDIENECQWSRERFVTVKDGKFNVILGRQVSLDDALFDGDHYIALSVKHDLNYKEIELRSKLKKKNLNSFDSIDISENIVLKAKKDETVGSITINDNTQTQIYASKLLKESGIDLASSSIDCNQSFIGSLRFNSAKNKMQYCDGIRWMNIVATPDEEPEVYASCSEILNAGRSTGDGYYKIKPPGANEEFEIYCDMTTDGGGWSLVKAEKFETSTNGWSSTNRITTCGSYGKILGGYNTLTGANSKQYDLKSIPHKQARVEVDYIKIDSWDKEWATVMFGGKEIYKHQFCFCSQNCQKSGGTCGGYNICGGSWPEERKIHISGTVDHSSNSIVLYGSSTVNQAANDESWGFDNVYIYVR